MAEGKKMESRNEILYQVTMYYALKLVHEEKLLKDSYIMFERKMQQKYAPISGGLFTDIRLDKYLI